VGEIVDLVAPQTEADPAAIVMQFLTAVCSIIGNGPHILVGDDKHPARLFVVLVGGTSRGRKGTSWGWIYSVLRTVDDMWPDRVANGLSSGEGLTWAVRDEIGKWVPPKKHATEPEYVIVDPGVDDKRLLVVEGEFAQTLRVAERDVSTLSATIRNAWDLRATDKLATLTKNNPCKGIEMDLDHNTKRKRDRNRYRRIAEKCSRAESNYQSENSSID